MSSNVIAVVLGAVVGGAVAAVLTVATVSTWYGDHTETPESSLTVAGLADYEVVAKGLLPTSNRGALAYVRYSLHGTTQEWSGTTRSSCYGQARIGSELPDPCR